MKILKKGGVVEKRGWEETKSMPHAPVVNIIKGKRSAFMYIFLMSDRWWGTEYQYVFSGFLGVSILQLLIIYRIYDYDMLTLSQ